MIIGGKEVRTDKLMDIRPPHDHHHLLGHYHQGDASHVQMAIDAALKAKPEWEKMSWESRAAIFLKAADLLAGPYRQRMNAVTMLGQSKNCLLYTSILQYLVREIDTILASLETGYRHTRFIIRRFNLRGQSPTETGKQTLLQPV